MNMLFAALWIAGSYAPPAEDDYAKFFDEPPAPVLRREFSLDGDVASAT